MTIVVGFQTGDATILLTDSQEVINDYSKTTTQKIHLTTYFNNWRLGIAASGNDTTYADAFSDDLQMSLGKFKEFDYGVIVKEIKSKLREFYKLHVWSVPKDERASCKFELLIALQGIKPNGSRALFYTHRDLLLPVDGYRSIGIGADVADLVCRSLNVSGSIRSIGAAVYNSPTEEMARFGVYVINQVKSAIHGCDGETVGAIFYGDGNFRWILGLEVKEIESWFAKFYDDQLPLLRLVSYPETNNEEFDKRLLQFNADMKLLRVRQATDAETSSKRYAEFLKAQQKAAGYKKPRGAASQKSKQKPSL